jgi:demethoxyubiquinone hydroxylase (CLK1/Coq7/Cat5 family)
MDVDVPRCFRTYVAVDAGAAVSIDGLTATAASALATLMPVLQCGEESASLVFEGLAQAEAPDDALALRHIASEERQHESLLHQLALALPRPDLQQQMRRAARRFYVRQQHRKVAVHFARIVALDSGACIILSHLLRPASQLNAAPAVWQIFRRIYADETRHVRLSRYHSVGRLPLPIAQDVAEQCRAQLADVLHGAGDAFEQLGVDARQLDARLRHVPRGLFT